MTSFSWSAAHAGTCPEREVLQKEAPCNDSCSDDRDCSMSQKCCFSSCGLQCLDPESGSSLLASDTSSALHLLSSALLFPDSQPSQLRSFFISLFLWTDVCRLPADGGPCKAYMPMFYYSPKTKTCAVFVYGGCGGNENRFSTMQECLWTCRYRGEGRGSLSQTHRLREMPP